MKKILLVVAVLMFAVSANAQLLLEENFDYTDADYLTNHGWSVTSAGAGAMILTTGGGLSYSGYVSSGIGNAALVDSTGQDDGRLFSGGAVTSGTLYFSFLVKCDAIGGTGYFTHLGGSTSLFASRIFGRTSGAGFNIGLSNTSTGTYGASVLTFGTTYLVVVKYDVSATGACSLWVFSSGIPADEATAGTAEVTATGSGQASIDRVCLRQFNAAQRYTVDGIRIGTTWNNAPLPVELTSFTATAKGRGIELIWKTATEVNNAGFEVQKNVGGTWNKIGYVEGKGTTNAPTSYRYADANAKGNVSYRLKQIDRDGKFEYSSIVEATVAEVKAFGLEQNYPNPFNPNTVISYQLPMNSAVTLKVYDAIGREVASLVNEIKEAGSYTAKLDGSQLSSGIYFYTLRAGNFTATKKLTLMK